ncbi:hypothetical protein EVAR_50762_1 [Eumeta japonica]|uniref:Uncharacterized protein n=1 Tax=Eumeta variegata TaxID=151549 RepID=A0A4C1Y3Q5_EUMVA|nr:hypothetical protein EVAR_50762_1 [Eumeta japonica]
MYMVRLHEARTDRDELLLNRTITTTARQLAEKLNRTLLKLKASGTSLKQILQKREDTQKEIMAELQKNKRMWDELVQLHSQLIDTREQKDQLQRTAVGCDRISGALEDALKQTALI